MSELARFRALKDEFFEFDEHSPLSSEQQKEFEGLEYFPENEDLRLELDVEEFAEKDEISMQTSTGDSQVYTRFGKIKFDVAGTPAELTLYPNEHGYFLPFVAALAGTETYPAGRYLEPEPLEGGKMRVDFNLAYNPYCAYNEAWSCPLTPFENRIKVPIQAGEKLFQHTA